MGRKGLAFAAATCLLAFLAIWLWPTLMPDGSRVPIQLQKAMAELRADGLVSKRHRPGEPEHGVTPQSPGSHRLILQVNSNDPAMMNLTLNNATNVAKYYADRGEKVKIEVVTFGPGLHMLREDTSPVKDRIETLALSTPEISFKACGNTRENMSRVENKDIPILSGVETVKSGVVHVMELQEKGWSYIKP
jgi:intracellular sulfur oxidation DsrE/DsrF family protein